MEIGAINLHSSPGVRIFLRACRPRKTEHTKISQSLKRHHSHGNANKTLQKKQMEKCSIANKRHNRHILQNYCHDISTAFAIFTASIHETQCSFTKVFSANNCMRSIIQLIEFIINVGGFIAAKKKSTEQFTVPSSPHPPVPSLSLHFSLP